MRCWPRSTSQLIVLSPKHQTSLTVRRHMQPLSQTFYANWVHTRKCMHPDLISKVMSIVHECWKAGENTEK